MAVHYDIQIPKVKTFSEIPLWTSLCNIAKVRKNQTRNQHYTGFSSEDLNSEKSDHFFKKRKEKLRSYGVVILAIWTGHQEQAHGEKLPGFRSIFQFLVQAFLGPSCTFSLRFLLSLYIYIRKSPLFKPHQVAF